MAEEGEQPRDDREDDGDDAPAGQPPGNQPAPVEHRVVHQAADAEGEHSHQRGLFAHVQQRVADGLSRGAVGRLQRRQPSAQCQHSQQAHGGYRVQQALHGPEDHGPQGQSRAMPPQDGVHRDRDSRARPGRHQLQQHAAGHPARVRGDAREVVLAVQQSARQPDACHVGRGRDDEQHSGAHGQPSIRVHARRPFESHVGNATSTVGRASSRPSETEVPARRAHPAPVGHRPERRPEPRPNRVTRQPRRGVRGRPPTRSGPWPLPAQTRLDGPWIT